MVADEHLKYGCKWLVLQRPDNHAVRGRNLECEGSGLTTRQVGVLLAQPVASLNGPEILFRLQRQQIVSFVVLPEFENVLPVMEHVQHGQCFDHP